FEGFAGYGGHPLPREVHYGNMTGSQFWECMKEDPSTAKLVRGSGPELFLCPLREDPPSDRIDYWGPALTVNRLAGKDPIACDAPGNHREGGKVLFKAGEIRERSQGDFEHFAARCLR